MKKFPIVINIFFKCVDKIITWWQINIVTERGNNWIANMIALWIKQRQPAWSGGGVRPAATQNLHYNLKNFI